MVPPPKTHKEFHTELQTELLRLARRRGRKYLRPYAQEILLVWQCPLDILAPPLCSLYPRTGRRARDPLAMFRALLLCHLRGVASLSEWVATLQREPVLRLLCGFPLNDCPGVGTFYDFCKRLCPTDEPKNRMRHPSAKKRAKPKPGQKAPMRRPGVVGRVVSRILRHEHRPAPHRPTDLWESLLGATVTESRKRGLLTGSLRLAGDSTPLESGAYSFGRKLCDCPKKMHCRCPRCYSDPDALNGWDSYRNRHYIGRSLYAQVDTGRDLPVSLLLVAANRHDATVLPFAFDRFRRVVASYGCHTSRLLLDSAHDNEPLYRLLRHYGVEPVIDLLHPLPPGHLSQKAVDEGLTLDAHDHPHCRDGHALISRGTASQGRPGRHWTCPLNNKKNAHLSCRKACAFRNAIIKVPLQPDPRLQGPLIPKTPAWQKAFAARTAVERFFSRIKQGFGIGRARHRRTYLWQARAYFAAILCHLCAWQDGTSAGWPHNSTVSL